MNDKPADTEGARADMRFARQYIDEWHQTNPKYTAEKQLEFALKYIAQARKKDQNAILQVKKKDYYITETLDALEAEVMWAFGSMETLPGVKASVSRQGIEHLHRALELDPLPLTYVTLANAHLHRNEHKQSAEVLQKGLSAFPNNFEICKALDELDVQPRPTNYRMFVISVACILLFFGIVLLSIQPLRQVGPGHFVFFLGLATLGIGLIMKPAK
jgi:tetratricopeptide (TPR) repeat protein